MEGRLRNAGFNLFSFYQPLPDLELLALQTRPWISLTFLQNEKCAGNWSPLDVVHSLALFCKEQNVYWLDDYCWFRSLHSYPCVPNNWQHCRHICSLDLIHQFGERNLGFGLNWSQLRGNECFSNSLRSRDFSRNLRICPWCPPHDICMLRCPLLCFPAHSSDDLHLNQQALIQSIQLHQHLGLHYLLCLLHLHCIQLWNVIRQNMERKNLPRTRKPQFDVYAQLGVQWADIGQLGSLLACYHGLLYVDQSYLLASLQWIPWQAHWSCPNHAVWSGDLLLLLLAWGSILGTTSVNSDCS